MYSNDSRLQNAGLIHSQQFDTVLMGTSLAIHFRQSDIDRILGVRSLKLAMPGSNSREQGFVLAAALERDPKRIIWRSTTGSSTTPRRSIRIAIFRPTSTAETPGDRGYLFSGAMARESCGCWRGRFRRASP